MSSSLTPNAKLVLLVHGIRTRANWQAMVADLIEKQTDYTAVPIKYGYFDALRFWLPISAIRNQPIERVHKEIREILRKSPGADLQVVAHSYGTQAICSVLEKYEDITLSRLIMCGSVVRANFNWSRISDQVGTQGDTTSIVNDCGTKDIWPVLARSTTWGYGSTGTHGFGTYSVRDRFHVLPHSGYFKPQFVCMYWLPFILDGKVVRTSTDESGVGTPWFFGLSNLPIYKWVMPGFLLWFVWTIAGLTPPGEQFQKWVTRSSCTAVVKMGVAACDDVRVEGGIVIDGRSDTTRNNSGAQIEVDHGVAAGGDVKAGEIIIKQGD